MSNSSAITSILHDSKGQPKHLAETLAPYVFDDLRRLARRFWKKENPGHTLQPTAVVNEVYLRLTGCRLKGFDNRNQFFGFAARLIREVLVDHARGRRTEKRGGEQPHVNLQQTREVSGKRGLPIENVLAVHQALQRLDTLDRRKATLVELRFFAGLTLPEAADVLEVSRATAERDWAFARRWLARELKTGRSALPS